MFKKNIVALAVGIGIFGLVVVLIVLRTLPPDTSGSAQDAAVVDVAFGSIHLPEEISRFEADEVKGFISVKPDKQTARIPVGLYNVRSWEMERKDKSGNDWALTGQYYGRDNQFEIKADTETKLDVGEPIIATVDATKVGSIYSFNQIIKGRGQEII